MLFAKGGELPDQLGGCGVAEAEVGPPQQADFVRPDLVELDPFGRKIRHLGQLGVGENTVLDQQIGADQELVAGEGGDRRIGRVPRPRRVQRQDLPPRSAGARQPLHVGRRGRSEVTDPVAGRQTGWMEDDPGRTLVFH